MSTRVLRAWIAILPALVPLAAAAAPEDGAALYAQRCASCHELPVERAPSRQALRSFPPEDIVAALTRGTMQANAQGLSPEQIRDIASHLSGQPFGSAAASEVQPNPCKKPGAPLKLAETQWNGWGRDLANTRYQPEPGLAAADVPKLKVKWTYAYSGRSANGQPTLVGDRVYVTSPSGRVSSLDAKTGCEYWNYEAGTGVKAAVVVGQLPKGSKARFAAFIGDQKSFAHAVDAETGALLWKTQIEEHPAARVTGSPTFHDGRLYVPLSSHEEGVGANPTYECCKFRGSIVALDARSGEKIWKTHTIPDEPKPYRKNPQGTQLYGPAGAAVWSSPTIDVKRKLIYAATGNSYTDVDTDGADAIVAFDLATGERKWASQVTADDNFLVRCGSQNAGQGNCPEQMGPDHDFGSSPVLRTLPDGRQVLLVGQKSGMVHALDPDHAGKVLWQTAVGHGSALGGVQWGSAADPEAIYVAISDVANRTDPLPGLTALRIATGEKIWTTPTPAPACAWGTQGCARAQSAAVSAIPGIVFSGAMDGHLRAYSTVDGSIVWDFDTGAAFQAVNGVQVEGGTLDNGGATIANGVVYVNSGYGGRARRGRVLIAFSVDGK